MNLPLHPVVLTLLCTALSLQLSQAQLTILDNYSASILACPGDTVEIHAIYHLQGGNPNEEVDLQWGNVNNPDLEMAVTVDTGRISSTSAPYDTVTTILVIDDNTLGNTFTVPLKYKYYLTGSPPPSETTDINYTVVVQKKPNFFLQASQLASNEEDAVICGVGDVQLSVDILNEPLSYTPIFAWSRNGAPLSNDSSYAAISSGLHRLEVSIPGCPDTTYADSIAVVSGSLPSITDQPDDVTLCQSNGSSFVVTTNDMNDTYIWKRIQNGTTSSFLETSSELQISNAGNSSSFADSARYFVEVSAPSGCRLSSDTALLVVIDDVGVEEGNENQTGTITEQGDFVVSRTVTGAEGAQTNIAWTVAGNIVTIKADQMSPQSGTFSNVDGSGKNLNYSIENSPLGNSTTRSTLTLSNTNGGVDVDVAISFSAENFNPIGGASCSSASSTVGTINFLPVELLYFNGSYDKLGIRLRWSTATERDNAFFTLQRSLDGTHFTTVATVEGSGNSQQALAYEWLDREAPRTPNRTLYYRLSQTDFDGNSETFEVISVLTQKLSALQLLGAHRDAQSLVLYFQKTTSGITAVRILDMSGRILFQHSAQQEAGLHEIRRSMAQLQPGSIYVLQLGDKTATRTLKLFW